MTRKVLLSIILATLLGGGAAAQTRQEGMVRVQLSVQLFIAASTDEGEEVERQRERVRRVIYELATKECDLLRAVIARDCRLENVSVSLSRQANPQMQGYQVGGSMSYQITLK